MNGEALVINGFFIFRVFLVGAMMFAVPRILRKGLLFGAYVGEEVDGGQASRDLTHRWDIGTAAVMAVALLVGLSISAAGWPLQGNLTGTAVLLLGAFANYLRAYSEARTLIPPDVAKRARVSIASLDARDPNEAGFASIVLGICLLVSLGGFVFTVVGSTPIVLSDKARLAALFVASLNLVISPFFALLGLLIANAKRSIRSGGDGSLVGQDKFRATMVGILMGSALLQCSWYTLISVELTRFGLDGLKSPGIWLLAVVLILFWGGSLGWAAATRGQGGAHLESDPETPLTGGLADNDHWFWGLFYVDRDDPSIMVEVRFGLGYTFNYGNQSAQLIVATVSVLLLCVSAFGIFAWVA